MNASSKILCSITNFNACSGSGRGIVAGADKSSLEMDTLGAESRQIRKQTDYDVRVEDVHTGKTGVEAYNEVHRLPSKSWIET